MKKIFIGLLFLLTLIIAIGIVSAENELAGIWTGKSSQGFDIRLKIDDQNGELVVTDMQFKINMTGVSWEATSIIHSTGKIGTLQNETFTYESKNENEEYQLIGEFCGNEFQGKLDMNVKRADAYRKAYGRTTFTLRKEGYGANESVENNISDLDALNNDITNDEAEAIEKEKQKALDWMAQNNKWGISSDLFKHFSENLEMIIELDDNAEWLLGWELTKSKTPYYLVWVNGTFIVEEMTVKQAKKEKLKKRTMNFFSAERRV